MLHLLSLWPHSDLSSMAGVGRAPDWQFCLLVWHGPVPSADCKVDLLQIAD